MSQASVWTPLYAAIGEPAARADARPGDVFPPDSNITASDAPNAAKLTAEGFVAVPLSAWTTGQRILIGPYAFNWTGAAWAAGTHALLREGEEESPPAEGEKDTYLIDGPWETVEPESEGEGFVVDGTIPEVKEYVEANPGEAEVILSDEEQRSGGPRVTLVSWLEDFISTRDAT